MNDKKLEMENLSYSDKQLIAKAEEDNRRLKEIKAHQSPEEKARIAKEVSLGLLGARQRGEEHRASKAAEDDKEDKERIEFKIKQTHNELW